MPDLASKWSPHGLQVSYSNPVRQSLYEFSDCLEGGKPKAQVGKGSGKWGGGVWGPHKLERTGLLIVYSDLLALTVGLADRGPLFSTFIRTRTSQISIISQPQHSQPQSHSRRQLSITPCLSPDFSLLALCRPQLTPYVASFRRSKPRRMRFKSPCQAMHRLMLQRSFPCNRWALALLQTLAFVPTSSTVNRDVKGISCLWVLKPRLFTADLRVGSYTRLVEGLSLFSHDRIIGVIQHPWGMKCLNRC